MVVHGVYKLVSETKSTYSLMPCRFSNLCFFWSSLPLSGNGNLDQLVTSAP